MMVTAQAAYIRVAPSLDAKVIKKAKYGDFVTPLDAQAGWTKVDSRGSSQGWIQSSILGGDEVILEAGKREIEKQAKQRKEEKDKVAQQLVHSYQNIGLKKMDYQRIALFLQWDESSWSQIPYDTKGRILESFLQMYPGIPSVKITGYYTGATLAENGFLSNTIN